MNKMHVSIMFASLFFLSLPVGMATAGECLYLSDTKMVGYDAQKKAMVTATTQLTSNATSICSDGTYIAATQYGNQSVLEINSKSTKANPKVLAGTGSCLIKGSDLYLPNNANRVMKAVIGNASGVTWLDITGCNCAYLMQTQYGMIVDGSLTSLFLITDFAQKKFKKITCQGHVQAHAGKYLFSSDASKIYRFELTSGHAVVNQQSATTSETMVHLTADLAANRLVASGRRNLYIYDLSLKLLKTIPLRFPTKPTFSTSNVYFYDLSGSPVGSTWTFTSNVYAVKFASCPTASTTCQNGQTRPCSTGSDVGECKKGTETCTNGSWGSCTGADGPSTEKCDGLDNNCDGSVDENWTDKGKACSLGQGSCAATGKQVCKSDGSGLECDATPGQPSQEQCNNIDDDCNGQVDDNIAPKSCSSSCGSGNQVCKNGSWTTCDAPTSCDCTNGQTQACIAGKGECQAGTRSCGADLKWGACTSNSQPTKEVCGDSKDNDCDGQIDNGCPTECKQGQTRPCTADGALGECKKGTQSCLNGKWDSCVAGQPSAEKCDGLDNNCDGKVDESLQRECSNSCGNKGKELCGNGKWGGDSSSSWAACNASACATECTPNDTRPCDHPICGKGNGVEICRADGKWAGMCTAPKSSTEHNPITILSGQAEVTRCGVGLYIVKGPKVQPLSVSDDDATFALIRVRPSSQNDAAYEFGLQGYASVNGPSLTPGRTFSDGYRIIKLNSRATGYAKVQNIKVDPRCPNGRCIAGLMGTVVGVFKDPATPHIFTWFTHKDLAILDLQGTDSKGNPVSVKGVRVTGTPVPGSHHKQLTVNTKKLDGLSRPITREQPTPPEGPKEEKPGADAGSPDTKTTTDDGPPNVGCSGCSTVTGRAPSPFSFFLGILLLLVLRKNWELRKKRHYR